MGMYGEPAGRLPAGLATPEWAYWEPILEVLEGVGRAPSYYVLQEVWFIVGDRLNAYDYGLISQGRVRWINKAEWAKKKMMEQGLLETGLHKGFWGVTEEGRQYLQSLRRARSDAA